MNVNKLNRNNTDFMIVLFLVLTTVSWVITTNASQLLVVAIRNVAAALLVINVAVFIFHFGIKRQQIVSVFLCLFLIGYALIQSLLHGTLEIVGVGIIQDSIVIFFGSLVLGYIVETEKSEYDYSSFFVWYSLVVMLGTLFLGGVILDFPPEFVFEYSANQLGRSVEETYSLGLSRFFGLAAVAAAFCVKNHWERLSQKIIGIILCILFLFLGFAGGGRGEVIIALIFALLFFLDKRSFFVFLVLIFVVVFSGFIQGLESAFEGSLSFQRFALLFEGDLSSRDELFRLSLDLLIDNIFCLNFGCGPGYFQLYHGFDFGMYPHNIVLEFVIIYGLPLFLIFAIFVLYGYIRHYRRVGGVDFLSVIYLYNLLVGLKSGYFFGSWIVVVFSLYFAALALSKVRVG